MNRQTVMHTACGIILCIALGALAFLLGQYIAIGAVALVIVLGIIAGNILKPGEILGKGISFCEKHVLAFSIALMGVNLDFMVLKELGYRSILLIVSALILTLLASLGFARLLKFDRTCALLLGIGHGICGNSAIAASKDIIGADEEMVGLSVAVVNGLGTIGMLLLPLIASSSSIFSSMGMGILIGNTLPAVGQVAAAGFSVAELAGQTAMVVKMTRILMLSPVILGLIVAFPKGDGSSDRGEPSLGIKVPLFIIGFILFSLIPTLGLLPESYIQVISRISKYALIIAMAGIGLKINFRSILKHGRQALLMGGLIFALQILYSCVMVYMLF